MNISDLGRAADAEAALSAAPTEPVPVSSLSGDDQPRDPLALAMFAAWVNVPVDQIPDSMKGHTCAQTMAAWKRVGEAALRYYEESGPMFGAGY